MLILAKREYDENGRLIVVDVDPNHSKKEYDKNGRLIIVDIDPNHPSQQMQPTSGNSFNMSSSEYCANGMSNINPVMATNEKPKKIIAQYDLANSRVTPDLIFRSMNNPELFFRSDANVSPQNVNLTCMESDQLHNNTEDIITSTDEPKRQNGFLVEGTYYTINECGLYAINEKGKSIITDALIEIVKKTEVVTKNFEKNPVFYDIEVFTPDRKIVKFFQNINSRDFLNVYSMLRKESEFIENFTIYSESFVHTKALNEYLHHVAANARSLETEKFYLVSGWYGDQEKDFFYKISTNNGYYRKFEGLSFDQEVSIFNNGIEWLKISNSHSLRILWIIAHAQFLRFLLERVGIVERFATYIEGENGSFKTTIAQQIANPFLVDANNRIVPIKSTLAAIESIISSSSDTLLLFDDVSFSPGKEGERLLENVEAIIRAVGDGRLRAKKTGKNFQETLHEPVISSVILTGERALPLQQSSLNRILTIHFERDMVNNTQLMGKFSNETQILARYFNLFVNYLEKSQRMIMMKAKNNFLNLKTYWREYFLNQKGDSDKLYRLQFCAIYLSTVANIIQDFSYQYMYPVQLDDDIKLIIQENLQQKHSASFITQFIKYFLENLNNHKGLIVAKSKGEFDRKQVLYIGYEKDDIFLRLKPTFINEVLNIMKCNKEAITMNRDSIKRELADKGIIERQGDKILIHNEIRLNLNAVKQFLD